MSIAAEIEKLGTLGLGTVSDRQTRTWALRTIFFWVTEQRARPAIDALQAYCREPFAALKKISKELLPHGAHHNPECDTEVLRAPGAAGDSRLCVHLRAAPDPFLAGTGSDSAAPRWIRPASGGASEYGQSLISQKTSGARRSSHISDLSIRNCKITDLRSRYFPNPMVIRVSWRGRHLLHLATSVHAVPTVLVHQALICCVALPVPVSPPDEEMGAVRRSISDFSPKLGSAMVNPSARILSRAVSSILQTTAQKAFFGRF
jgi:hypothetical protein